MTSWILAARPKTLPAAIVPVALGTVLAWHDTGQASLPLALATLLSCVCIQIATNLFNDALDAQKGADTEKRLGPIRVTSSGRLSGRAVMTGGLLFCGGAILFGLPLVLTRGPVVVLIGVLSLLLAYAYTGGPFPLAYRGLGEVFVILFFGFVATLGSLFVQTGATGGSLAWIVALQSGLLSSALIAINNLRDAEEDAGTGKRTLAVRFGRTFGRWEITAFCAGPYLLGLVFWPQDPWAAALPWLAAPLAFVICRGVWTQVPSRAYNRFLAMAGGHLILFAVLLSAGLLQTVRR